MMSEQRDTDLGARLDELELLEHGPEYWRAVMEAAEPKLERLRAAAADEPPVEWTAAEDGGAAETASPRRSLAALVERHPTFGGGFKWWATAAVAAAAAVGAISYALSALDRYPGIEGTIASQSVGADPAESWSREMSFVAAPDGSLRAETRNTEAGMAPRAVKDTLVYDAPARASRALSDWSELQPYPSVDPGGGSYFLRWWLEKSGLAAAEPDCELEIGGFPLWRLRAYLRTMMSDPRARFTATEQHGRPVWVLSAEAVTLDGSGDRLVPVALPVVITIDAVTRLPLTLARAGIPGGVNGELARFDIHPLSDAPAHDRFTLQRPDDPGTHVDDGSDGSPIGGNQGFRNLSFGDARPCAQRHPAWPPSHSGCRAASRWRRRRPRMMGGQTTIRDLALPCAS